MAHKMGLVNINLSSTSADKIRYYINSPTYTKNIGTYEWYSAKQTVYASSSYSNISPNCVPFAYSSYVHYYVTKKTGTTQFSTSNTLAAGYDNPNSWTYSVTNSSIADGKSLSVTKTPSTTYLQKTAYTLALGDVFYSDGSVSKPGSSNLYAGKTPIGVVVFIPANDTEKAWAEPSHNGGRALVMALTNYNKSTTGYYLDTSVSSGYPVWSGKPSASASSWTNDKSGWTNCYTYLNKTTNPASYYAMRHSPSAPSSSSGWFLPSAGQWLFIFGRLYGASDATITSWALNTSYGSSSTAFNTANNYLKNYGGTDYQLLILSDEVVNVNKEYWSSSSQNNDTRSTVWYACFRNSYEVKIQSESDKGGGDHQNLVRPFLAF